MTGAGRRSGMRTPGLLAVPALATLATLVALVGCGSETSPAAGADAQSSPTLVAAPPPTAPSTTRPSTGTAPAENAQIGTVVVNAALGVEASEFPGPPIPAATEVSGADELESTYGVVPGIEQVVAAVAASPPAAGERLFVYVVAACLVEDISLELTSPGSGTEVAMVVRGNTTLKCQPPPMHMVVWKVRADEVPAAAVPAPAVQKR